MNNNRLFLYSVETIIKTSKDYSIFQIIYKNEEIGFIIEFDEGYKTDFSYIDIFILPEYRNMGIGTDAMKKFIDFTNKKRLYIKTENKKSMRWMNKIGFRYVEENLYKNLFKLDIGEK